MKKALGLFAGFVLGLGVLFTLAAGNHGIRGGGVAPGNLSPALQDAIPYLTLTPTDNANGTGGVLISVRDAAGNPLAGRFAVSVWAASTDMGPPIAQEELGYNKGEGVWLVGFEENLILFVITAADGECGVRVTLTGGGTRYVMATLGGRIVSATLVITDPE